MRTILLGDIGNRLDIEDAEYEIADLKQRERDSQRILRSNDEKISSLMREVAKQKLAIQALTRFLLSKGMIDQSELDDFIREVDAEDGVIDGQMTVDSKKQRLAFPPAYKGGQDK